MRNGYPVDILRKGIDSEFDLMIEKRILFKDRKKTKEERWMGKGNARNEENGKSLKKSP